MPDVLHEIRYKGRNLFIFELCPLRRRNIFFRGKEAALPSGPLKNHAITHNGIIISSPESYSIVKEHSSWERGSIR
jgi:hypothetical protein